MAQFYSNEIAPIVNPPTTLGGLQGSTKYPRQTVARGGLMMWRWTYTVPASGGPVINDVIDLAYLKPQSVIYFCYFTFSAAGAGATFSVGKYDPNNPSGATTDPVHYYNAVAIAAAGNSGQFVLNMGEQVGLDNYGDLSTGNTPPMFGAAPVTIRGTFAGAIPAAGTTLTGYVGFLEGGAD